MDDSEKLGLLSAGLGDLLQSGLFSDLKVMCGDGSIHNVHKSILCAQSSFFKNALNPQSSFKEGKTNVIDLGNDDPAAVQALLEYCYRFNYTSIEGDLNDVFFFHISVYTVGEKYFIEGLKRLSASLVNEVYSKSRASGLGLHLKAPNLELDFASAVRTIYESTAARGDSLRNLVVKIANDDFDSLMRTEGFGRMLREVDQFSNDLGSLMLKNRRSVPKVGRYCCCNCGVASYMEQTKETAFCPACGWCAPVNIWRSAKRGTPLVLQRYKCPTCTKHVSMELLGDRNHKKLDTACIACGRKHSRSQWLSNELDDDDEIISKD